LWHSPTLNQTGGDSVRGWAGSDVATQRQIGLMVVAFPGIREDCLRLAQDALT
jgi:hypothetical protein